MGIHCVFKCGRQHILHRDYVYPNQGDKIWMCMYMYIDTIWNNEWKKVVCEWIRLESFDWRVYMKHFFVRLDFCSDFSVCVYCWRSRDVYSSPVSLWRRRESPGGSRWGGWQARKYRPSLERVKKRVCCSNDDHNTDILAACHTVC